jgi:hypothetical protein
MKNLIAAVLLLCCGSVQAELIRWTLNDVVMSDGQTLTGSFVYNSEVYSGFSDINISNSGSNVAPETAAASWDRKINDSPGACGTGACSFGNSEATTGAVYLSLRWYGGGGVGVPNWDKTLRIDEPVFWTCTNDACTGGRSSAGVYLVSGYLSSSAVPIPAAVWLFGSALAGLGWMRRKKS